MFLLFNSPINILFHIENKIFKVVFLYENIILEIMESFWKLVFPQILLTVR